MTFEEAVKNMLYNCGMFERQAEAVSKAMKADEANAAMKDRWNDNIEDYPPVMMALMWMSAKQHALQYIDENCPNAWFRPLFAENAPMPPIEKQA